MVKGVALAEWLSRVPAKYMGFPARVRISQATLFFLFFIFFTGEREIFFFFFNSRKKINTLQFLFYYRRKINIVQNSYSRVLNISKRKREKSRILDPMGTGNLTVYLNFIYKIFLVALPQYFKKKKGEISGSSPNGGGKKINTLQFLFYYKRKINIVQNLYSRALHISKRKRERSRILVPMGTGNLTVYLNFIYKIFLVALPQYFKKKKGDISGSSPNGGRKSQRLFKI